MLLTVHTLAHRLLRTKVITDFALRPFAGSETETGRKENGSNLTVILSHSEQVIVDFSWPCIKSTMMLSFCRL